jgi:hypothetical protein
LPLEDTLELNSLIIRNNYNHHHWIAKRDSASNQWSLGPVSQWTEFFAEVPEENVSIFMFPLFNDLLASWILNTHLCYSDTWSSLILLSTRKQLDGHCVTYWLIYRLSMETKLENSK